jgi:phospholipid/cholesterol/gamma-HCH transport system permease protein
MPSEKVSFDYSGTNNTLSIKFNGDWRISTKIPQLSEATSQFLAHPDIKNVSFDTTGLSSWDSSLIAFLCKLIKECRNRSIAVQHNSLPEGIKKITTLALKTNNKEIPLKAARGAFLDRVGEGFIGIKESVFIFFDFLGDIVYAFGRLLMGKAYFRKDEFMLLLQRCGASALGLVSLISLLVGVILAFVGAMQLKLFGAQIYIADIVGIAMVRVMGAVMTGILMSGRTGASFAAELGIMQTNEEIDAFKTLGIDPVEFLVIPRILALVIMMPLLTLYADLMGIFGGFIISVSMLNLNPVEYLNHTQVAIKMNNLWVGLTHSIVFGVIIAISGCLRGIKCERSASGVGEATTSAVVTSITAIVIATAVITFICQVLGV